MPQSFDPISRLMGHVISIPPLAVALEALLPHHLHTGDLLFLNSTIVFPVMALLSSSVGPLDSHLQFLKLTFPFYLPCSVSASPLFQ